MTDESFDLLLHCPVTVDDGIVGSGNIRNKHRFSRPGHVRQLSFGFQRHSVMRTVDPAPIDTGFERPPTARAHMQGCLFTASTAHRTAVVLVEEPDPSEGDM